MSGHHQVHNRSVEDEFLNVLVQDIWNQVLEGFSRHHGKAILDLWLKHTRPMSFSKGLFILGVPNLFVQEWLERKYIRDLEGLFVEVTGCPVKVITRIDGYLYRLMKENRGKSESEMLPGATGRTESPASMTPLSRRGGLNSQSRDSESRAESTIETDRDVDPVHYVVRPENRLVFSAFERILREPPGLFNPLYFFGPEGVGKSLLVRHFLKRSREQDRFPCSYRVRASEFAREFSAAARIGNRVRFRGAILRSDLFILEDLDELQGKLKLQAELLSVLKYLTERSRQVIITSEAHPRDIGLIENSLISFLLSGMTVSIPGYGLNSTVEILSEQCSLKGLKVPPTLIEAVAKTSQGGLKGLFTLIQQSVDLAEQNNEAHTPRFLKEHFPQFSRIPLSEDSVEMIIQRVSSRLNVTRDQIASNVKIRKVVVARHLVIYLASTLLKTSARRICRWLGNISPSIVPYAKRKVDARRREDPDFNALVLDLQSEVEGGQKYLF